MNTGTVVEASCTSCVCGSEKDWRSSGTQVQVASQWLLTSTSRCREQHARVRDVDWSLIADRVPTQLLPAVL